MKLEVGKKYVDRSGDVWEIVHKVKTSYVGDCSVGTTVGFFDYEGYYKSDDDETCDLVKEYHEPRPAREVVADLVALAKSLVERELKRGNISVWCDDKLAEALLKEAEGLEL